jgi:hypothetical protein
MPSTKLPAGDWTLLGGQYTFCANLMLNYAGTTNCQYI